MNACPERNLLPFLQQVSRQFPLDGKALCGTLSGHWRTLQMLALLDQHTSCVLGQMSGDPDTNEAKAALKMLTEMVVKGRVIVADAMFCQRDVFQRILGSGPDTLQRSDYLRAGDKPAYQEL